MGCAPDVLRRGPWARRTRRDARSIRMPTRPGRSSCQIFQIPFTANLENFSAGASAPLVVNFGPAGTATLQGDGVIVSVPSGMTNGFGRLSDIRNEVLGIELYVLHYVLPATGSVRILRRRYRRLRRPTHHYLCRRIFADAHLSRTRLKVWVVLSCISGSSISPIPLRAFHSAIPQLEPDSTTSSLSMTSPSVRRNRSLSLEFRR